jgi:hypothetical protein
MLHSPGPAVQSQNKVDPNRMQSFVLYDEHTDLKDKPGHQPIQELPVEGAALKFVLEDGNFPSPPKSGSDASKSPSGGAGGAGGASGGAGGTGTGTDTSPSTDPTRTGQGAKWFVKGGSFKFRISTDFALSHALVAAGSNQDGAGVEVPNLQKKPQPADTGIYSRPMRVSQGIASELSVTIKLKSSGHVVGGWTKAAFDIKAVPTATFGKYDHFTDPSNRNGDASSLFSAKNSTMPLAMGLMLTAPLPHLAESFIPVFKASDAAMLGVKDFRFVSKGSKTGTHWFVPRFVPAVPDLSGNAKNVILAPQQAIYIPAELTAAEQKATNQQRWDDVGQKWTDLAESKKALVSHQVDGLLARCAKIFAWDQNVPQSPATSTTGGAVAGGTVAGGTVAGGTVAGGTVAGGTVAGGTVAGGTVAGGSAPAAGGASQKPVTTAASGETTIPDAGTAATTTTITVTPATTKQPWQLVGAFPAKLVRSHKKNGTVVKNLEATYLALPRLAVVT